MAEQQQGVESSALPSRRMVDTRTEPDTDRRPVNPLTGAELTTSDLDRTLDALRGIGA